MTNPTVVTGGDGPHDDGTRQRGRPDQLEAERDFLLRSLDDLEAERDAGNIDDDTYRTLHDDYTARAAAVIRVAARRDRRAARGGAHVVEARGRS